MNLDVIIPVYRPDEKLMRLLEGLRTQTRLPQKVLLINTDEALFQECMRSLGVSEEELSRGFPEFELLHIEQKEFDHGGTRRRAVRRTHSEIFVMMTQDAIPANDHLLENLVWPLQDDKSPYGRVAVSYARQLPGEDSGIFERFSRNFNYPDRSVTKTSRSLESLGVKTFFCSDVCAAYRRDAYERLGGFVRKTIFNEDMIFAAAAIKAGYSIRYEASAQVIHAHDYTNRQQLRRNFDLGVSQAQHPEVFAEVSSESEGKKLVAEATRHLLRERKIHLLPKFYLQCFSKYAGFWLGKRYASLPKKWVKRLTASPWYW